MPESLSPARGEPIRFDGVWRAFGKKIALRDFSLSVRPGEVVALLGANGAGKTTAIKILLGHLRPSAGEARLFGSPAWDLPPEARRRVGYMAEGNRLDPWARVRDLVEFVRAFHPAWNSGAAARLLEWFDLPLDARVRTLSNGQRGQLALVLALVPDPEVLVLDDPMLGIDAVVRNEFFRTIAEVLSREGRAVLFTTHILPDVERVADRVVILSQGRIHAEGSVEFLRSRIRRYRLRFVDGVPFPDAVPGVLSARAEGRGWSVVGTDAEAFRRLDPVSLEEEELTLEEIFVALSTPARRVGPIPLP